MERILTDSLENILADRFERYSKYIIQSRALPDARDGMKPVQRRILWAMHETGNTCDKPYHKSAKTVGDVMGKYHPHGDSSIYDAMVRMSQPWKVSIPLIDMQGNNGSIDDDPAAAMRYTEARLSKMANYMMKDIEKDTVAWAPNYSDERMEPTVLPASYPNLLIGGISGISSGYATNIPTHNLTESIQAVIYRLQNPKCTVDELMNIIPGPDFPTGGIVMGRKGIEDAFNTGRGKVFIRSKCKIEKKKTMQQIVVTEIPYEVVKSQLVSRIDLIRIDKKIDGLLDVRDESDRTGLKIVIDIKKDANAKAILNYLYKNTDLQISYNYNMVAIYNKSPVTMSLPNILDAFIEHREDVIARRTKYDLEAKKKRLHIVEGMIRAISILDDVVKTIRNSKNKADAKINIQTAYGFTEIQSEAIVTMALYRLTNTDIKTLEKEQKTLNSEIKKLSQILKSKKNLHQQIIKELEEIITEVPQPRKTKIQDEIEEIQIDHKAMIADEQVMVTVSKDGYIKKCSLKSYNSSNNANTGQKEGDSIIYCKQMSTLQNVLIITDNGNGIIIPVYKIPDAKWKDVGVHISNNCKSVSGEKMVQVFEYPDTPAPAKQLQFVLVTKNGNVKRIEYSQIKKDSIERSQSLISVNDDELISVHLINKKESKYIILFSREGLVSRYTIDQIPVQHGGKGVKGMKLSDTDALILSLIQKTEEEQVILYTTTQWKRIKTAQNGDKAILGESKRPVKGQSYKKDKELLENLKGVVVTPSENFIFAEKETKTTTVPLKGLNGLFVEY